MQLFSAWFRQLKIDGSSQLFVICLFLACFISSSSIPAFQSPDEPDHVKRAYLLSQGQIILKSIAGQASGGMVDSGLIAYMAAYSQISTHPDRKIVTTLVDDAEQITWSGIKEQSPAPGTGYYFPAIYAPQATGLALGEALGWTVGNSYRLARLSALLTSCLLLLLAFSLHRPAPMVLALLALPMTMFQLSAASLDGVSNAVTVLTLSLFFLIARGHTNWRWALWAMSLFVFLVASSRVHVLPLVILIFATYTYTKDRKSLYAGVLVTLLILVWLVVAIRTTVDTRVITGLPMSSLITYYLSHPLSLLRVLTVTVTNPDMQHFYQKSFIGILGWLDAPFTGAAYKTFWFLLLLILAYSVSVGTFQRHRYASSWVILAAFGSIFMVFFALLLGWNTHPAKIIEGVQGRYFFVPALMITYAIGTDQASAGAARRRTGLILVAVLFLYSVFQSGRLLLDRYYMVDELPTPAKYTLKPSPQLAAATPIVITLDERQLTSPQPLAQLGLMLGTYGHANPGVAELRLRTAKGHTMQIPFDLSSLTDNQYRFFSLDNQPYIAAEIRQQTGIGISTWEAHSQTTGAVTTCVIYEASTGAKRSTRGCPRR